MPRTSLLVCFLVLATGACAARRTEWPGPRADGSILLPNGWSLTPHGEQLPLAQDLPVRLALQPLGRLLAVQHAGYREHTVVLVDLDAGAVVQVLPIAKSWSGLAWSADGARLFVSGGVEDRVHVFAFDPATRRCMAEKDLVVGDGARLDLVAGLCVDEHAQLFVCLQRSDRLVRLDAEGRTELEVAFPPGAMPFECVLAGGELWVSLWGAAQVWALDPRSGEVRARVATGSHPSQLLADGARLFVSNSNENTVSVVDVAGRRVEETLSSALYPLAPPGSTPDALALDASGRTLLVANADNNDLALLDVSERGRARALGFVPVGAYPTAVVVEPRSGRVIVANGKGSRGSRANPQGPQPVPGKEEAGEQYTGALFPGSLSFFPLPDEDELARLSARALANAPLAARAAVRGLAARPPDSPIPARVGERSPIRHCVYIVKENRTYDQILGDMPEGNGAAELCLFPEQVTPNHHALAREWVLLDNFYVEAEVSADGHEWTMGAYASDFVERTWPVAYGGKGSTELEGGGTAELGYPSEGNFDIATPESGYLFDLAARAGLTYRSYGEFVDSTPGLEGDERASIDALKGHFDPDFRGWDLDHTDQERAEQFLSELAAFECEGEYPQLVVLRLPNDHTAGTVAGKRTPRAYVADNDLALGRVLEGLSRSRFWDSMAVFVVEDDAQNGPDHVDAHRTVGLVAGPYARRGAVVHTLYSTCSVLRTMELLLGLPPLSQFDAAARPMYDCFQARPDARRYEARAATWPLDELNAATAWGGARSAQFDFTREDAVDDQELIEVVWKSIRGADSPVPAPRHAAFVRALDDE
ncbi:MAG: phosphoesterase [Planctomycetes bacterium]|nr:phosphoesterase [Planctomycetota bacterium]